MLRFLSLTALLAGCSSAAAYVPSAPDAGDPGSGHPSQDGGIVVETPDSAPDTGLWTACDPSAAPDTCPAGLTCYGTHTAPSWAVYDGGDLFGHCVMVDNCQGEGAKACNAMDGTCACPVLPNGVSEDCYPLPDGGNPDAEKKLVCIPIPR